MTFEEQFKDYYKEFILQADSYNNSIWDATKYIYCKIFDFPPYTGVSNKDKLDNKATYENLKNNNFKSIRVTSGTEVLYNEDLKAIVLSSVHEESPSLEWYSESDLSELVVLKNESPQFGFVTNGQHGFECNWLDVKKVELNVEDNYNDDIPISKINNFIAAEDSGIAIFHGDPGCGKSFFIRYLIKEHSKQRFLIMDSSCFSAITSTSFINFLIEHKNSIIIMEDCEELLVDRGSSRHGYLTTLLNISDGILGDSLKLRFICTFNCDINRIDKAITRKGRLKIKYEFKPLVKDKADKLIAKLGKDSAGSVKLCDIYNAEDNGGKTERKRIGF